MTTHEKYMQRCLELASHGLGLVAPNPMVGCVILHEGKIIGEGFHHEFGGAHAEVNAINSVKNKSLLSKSTLYVSLEPCSHHGKTPPCADLIIEHQIPQVVIGSKDSNPQVGGKGIEKLQKAGVEVITGVLENECRELNKRFFTFHEQKRPYIILKWAQSSDGFIDHIRDDENHGPATISSETSRSLVHKWRSEEQAIMVGTNTAILDNPQLTVRLWKGKNPLRVVPDSTLRVSPDLHLLDGSTPTLVITSENNKNRIKKIPNTEYAFFKPEEGTVESALKALHERGIQSLIVEGGSLLLNFMITHNYWDEARVFVSPKMLGEGIHAPKMETQADALEDIAEDKLYFYRRKA